MAARDAIARLRELELRPAVEACDAQHGLVLAHEPGAQSTVRRAHLITLLVGQHPHGQHHTPPPAPPLSVRPSTQRCSDPLAPTPPPLAKDRPARGRDQAGADQQLVEPACASSAPDPLAVAQSAAHASRATDDPARAECDAHERDRSRDGDRPLAEGRHRMGRRLIAGVLAAAALAAASPLALNGTTVRSGATQSPPPRAKVSAAAAVSAVGPRAAVTDKPLAARRRGRPHHLPARAASHRFSLAIRRVARRPAPVAAASAPAPVISSSPAVADEPAGAGSAPPVITPSTSVAVGPARGVSALPPSPSGPVAGPPPT
jgi:hypothetical protein